MKIQFPIFFIGFIYLYQSTVIVISIAKNPDWV